MLGVDLESIVSIFHFAGALLGKQIAFNKKIPTVDPTLKFPYTEIQKLDYESKDSYEKLYESTKFLLKKYKDKKIGMPLSGGIDSSVILYTVQEINKKENLNLDIIAYNQIFDDRDESTFAQIMADQTDTKLKILHQTPQDTIDELDELLTNWPEPLMGNVHIYKLNKLMKKDGCNITINSLGGDECWGGYPSHRLVHNHIFSKHIYTKQNIKSKILRAAISPINKKMFWYYVNARFNPNTNFLNPNRYSKYTKRIGVNITNLINNSRFIWTYYPFLNPSIDLQNKGLLSLWEANEYFTFYKCDKLYKHQINASGEINGLKVLFPYLEENYVKYSLALDKKYKIHEGISKWGMREMMKERLPKEVLMRGAYGDKFGWGETYQVSWYSSYKELIDEYLSKEKIAEFGVLNWSWINRTFQKLSKRFRGAEARVLISMAIFQKILELHNNNNNIKSKKE